MVQILSFKTKTHLNNYFFMQKPIKTEIEDVINNTTWNQKIGLFKVFAVAFAISYDIIDGGKVVEKMREENISNDPNVSVNEILYFFDKYNIYDVIEWAFQVNRCMEENKNYTEFINFPNKEVSLELYKILYDKILKEKYQEDNHFFTIYCREIEEKMKYYAEIEDFDKAIYYRDKLKESKK